MPVYGNLKSMENIVHVILCIGVIVCAVRTVFLEFRIHEVPPSVGFLNYNGKVEISNYKAIKCKHFLKKGHKMNTKERRYHKWNRGEKI